MGFNINQKIEEIRQKPEHIRMRYVWGWLIVSMLFIFTIWVFSVKESFKAVNFDQGQLPDFKSGMPDLEESIPSIKDMQKSIEDENMTEEGFRN